MSVTAASTNPPLILASSSVYRRELLSRLRLPFDVVVPDVDETPRPGERPEETALRLAAAKAAKVAAGRPGALVIGSDQVATMGDDQIGKPGSPERAIAQLRAMRGNTVVFHTALCLHDGRSGKEQLADVQTKVRFRQLSDAEIEAYLDLEQPYDCAGSAKAETLGITLMERIESDDPTSLIGLPLIALTGMLRAAGYPLYG
ncbi:MAG: Maf family nucleotide pyrophosphatase [Candidatus Protistobacter heckmanni]|nr:Maf family nucleotide pyrophosphatase [Candidatus Protistobacter heckmanni]